jgi:hypothetical protein
MVKKKHLPNGEHLSPFVGPLVYKLSDQHKLADRLDFDRRDATRIRELVLKLEEDKLKQQLSDSEKREIEDRIQKFKDPPEGFCLLRTSSESHWVAAFAEHIIRRCCKQPTDQDARDDAFSHFVEIPSTRSEVHAACGYDLSIGPYQSSDRIRTMHKTKLTWCDRDWTWSAKSDDLDHARYLCEGAHKVFLVIHVFFCIHDWRRMGMKETGPDPQAGITLPKFTSLLRTVIIDLKSLPGLGTAKDWTVKYDPPAPTGGTPQEQLKSLVSRSHYRITLDGKSLAKDQIEVAVMDLEAFRGVIAGCWGGVWKGYEI